MSVTILAPTVKTIGLSGYGGRKKQTLLTAALHNHREIQKELGVEGHIDAGRVHLNEVLAGPVTAAGVSELAQSKMASLGYNPKRKDFTQAFEVLFTLPKTPPVDIRRFFEFCLDFLRAKFPGDAVLSAIIHRDEGAPHMHALILPIADGRYVGSKLITKPLFAALLDQFGDEVYTMFDLKVMMKLSGQARIKVAQLVHQGLHAALKGLVADELLEAIQKAALRDPATFLDALQIETLDESTNDGGAAFRKIALSTGKGGQDRAQSTPTSKTQPDWHEPEITWISKRRRKYYQPPPKNTSKLSLCGFGRRTTLFTRRPSWPNVDGVRK